KIQDESALLEKARTRMVNGILGEVPGRQGALPEPREQRRSRVIGAERPPVEHQPGIEVSRRATRLEAGGLLLLGRRDQLGAVISDPPPDLVEAQIRRGRRTGDRR